MQLQVDYGQRSTQRMEGLLRVVGAALQGWTDAGEISIAPVGSALLHTATHQSPVPIAALDAAVDLAVTIPAGRCSVDDVQGGKYLAIRNAFLKEARQQLESALLTGDVATADDGSVSGELDAPAGSNLDNAVATVSTDIFKDSAEKNTVVVRVTFPKDTSASRGITAVRVLARPSEVTAKVAAKKAIDKHALYSNLVLEDFLMTGAVTRCHSAYKELPALLRATVLAKAWASHAGLTGFHGGLCGFTVAAMMLELLDAGLINATMTDDNMLRALWVQLNRGLFVKNGKPHLSWPGQNLNVLHRCRSEFLTGAVKDAAEVASRIPTPQEVFTLTAFKTPFLRNDVSLRVSGLPAINVIDGQEVMKGNWSADPRSMAEDALNEVISKAFKGRMTRILVTATNTTGTDMVVSGEIESEQEARSRLTRGPSIEDADGVAEFNAFWGDEKVTTRQFPDGGINRCVVWENPHVSQTAVPPVHDVLCEILQHSLRRTLENTSIEVSGVLGTAHGLLQEPIGDRWVDASQQGEYRAKKAVLQLKDAINNLGGSALPCKVTSFEPVSASVRSTDVFGVRPHLVLQQSGTAAAALSTAAPTLEPIHCVLHIDDKHKIPDNAEAIAKMKGALCAQLSKALQSKYVTLCTSTAVDAIVDGFLLRIHVGHYREVSLFKALGRDAEAQLIERKLFWSVRHHAFVASVSNGFPSYGYAVRIAQRWVGSMLLSDYILPEVVELTMAAVFQRAQQNGRPPATAAAGFAQWLGLIATHDWALPLVLPFVDASEVDKALASSNRTPGTMWIAAPYAEDASPFTVNTPRPAIVRRLVALAKGALTQIIVASTIAPNADVDASLVAASMRPAESDYDLFLSLSPELVLQPERALTATRGATDAGLRRLWQLDELKESERQRYLHQLAELEPASQCVRKLRGLLRESAMVFHDSVGPAKVGVVLLAADPHPKKVNAVVAAIKEALPGAFSDLPAPLAVPAPAEASPASAKKGRKQNTDDKKGPGAARVGEKRTHNGTPAKQAKSQNGVGAKRGRDSDASPASAKKSSASPKGKASPAADKAKAAPAEEKALPKKAARKETPAATATKPVAAKPAAKAASPAAAAKKVSPKASPKSAPVKSPKNAPQAAEPLPPLIPPTQSAKRAKGAAAAKKAERRWV